MLRAHCNAKPMLRAHCSAKPMLRAHCSARPMLRAQCDHPRMEAEANRGEKSSSAITST
jgi:hypothetical protein